MNLGEFIIKIGTQGDTKELEKAIKKLEEAEKKTRRMIKVQQDLAKATNEEEKALINKNAAQQDELDGLKAVKSEQEALNSSMQKSIGTALKMVGAFGATVTMLDRLGNSLIKANQMYITFEKQSGISISRLNRMAGIAQMAGTGLSPEQVAGDLSSLQQKIARFSRFGENAKTFGMLGINPRGMKSDQLLLGLRKSLKKFDGETKSIILSELGLSQEWLHVLDLSDEKFKDYLKTSKELQLSEKERKQLAKYMEKQQKNNMRWELAKQKLLIAVMPMVQQIMEVASKAALVFANLLEKNPPWLPVVRDVLLMFIGTKFLSAVRATMTMAKALKELAISGAISGALGGTAAGAGLAAGAAKKKKGGLFGGITLGKLFGKKSMQKLGTIAGKQAAKAGVRIAGGQAAAAGAGAATGGAGWGIAEAVLIGWGLIDIVGGLWDWLKDARNEDRQEEEMPTPDPDEGAPRYQYHNVKSNMTNNFFNNPQPAKEAIQQLSDFHNLILAEQYR